MPDSPTNDNDKSAHNLQTLLQNVESVSNSASAVGRECRQFMALLQQVLAGPGAKAFMEEMGESLKRLVDAFDGYSSAVIEHSVAFAVAAEDAKTKIEVLREGGRHDRERIGDSSSSIPHTTEATTTPPRLRIRTKDAAARASPSEACLYSHLPPLQPSTHYTPEPCSRTVSPDPDCDPSKMTVSRTASPDPNPDSQTTQDLDGAISMLGEVFGQVRVSGIESASTGPSSPEPSQQQQQQQQQQRSPKPSLSLSLKADFTFRAAPSSSSSSSSPSTNRSPSSPQRKSLLTPPSPSTAPSSASSSPIRPSFHNLPYEVVAEGVNAYGNRWENRDYGPDAPNRNAYYYSNADGSFYYSNWDGSQFWSDGKGRNGRSWMRQGKMAKGRGGGGGRAKGE